MIEPRKLLTRIGEVRVGRTFWIVGDGPFTMLDRPEEIPKREGEQFCIAERVEGREWVSLDAAHPAWIEEDAR